VGEKWACIMRDKLKIPRWNGITSSNGYYQRVCKKIKYQIYILEIKHGEYLSKNGRQVQKRGDK